MKVEQSYKFGSSAEFTFSVDELQSGISLFSNKPGTGGIDFMPAVGDTVTVYSNTIGTSGDVDFKPTLNNKLFWLVSSDLMNDYDEVISQATSIAVSLVSGRYEGSFIYSNPNDWDYLYIISDYTNNIPISSSVTHTFAEGDVEVIDAGMDAKVGLATATYTIPAGNTRIAIEYGGNIVADTGVIAGPASSSLKFVRLSSDPDTARFIVDKVLTTGSVTIGAPTVSLTLFYMYDGGTTLGSVCAQVATGIYYHNGLGTLPVAGDIVYTDPLGESPAEGSNLYHVVSTVSMVVPSASSLYIGLSPTGVALTDGSCVCSEVAVPVITQTDITVTQNQPFSIYVEATNNPNSWEMVTLCEEYSLDGGVRGAVFSYTDCDAIGRTATVSINQKAAVCASIAPTVDSGTGTVTLIGPCQEKSLPTGISFNDGIISGTATASGRQTIELIASNCFGDSANATFDVIVESSINLTPVAVDITEPSDTGAAACALTGVYELLYHNNKVTRYPELNTVVYYDHKGVDRFVGGSLWYKVSGSLQSIQVDSLGVVIDVHTC